MKIVKNILIKCINTYTTHFSFPKRGMGLFLKFLKKYTIQKELFKKKCNSGIFCYVNAEDHIQKIILWTGEYEKEVYDFAKKVLTNEDIVLDIGANIGYHSIHFASLVPNGKVYCFEPNALLNPLIEKNFKLNGFTNFEIENKAVSNKNEVSSFFISNSSNTGLSILTNEISQSNIEVKTIYLDDYFKTQKIHLIKIDIEGAELNALKGMKQLLQTQSPYIIIELIEEQLNKFNSTCSEVYEFLLALGYNAFLKQGNNYLKIIDTKTEGYSIFFIPNNKEKQFLLLLSK